MRKKKAVKLEIESLESIIDMRKKRETNIENLLEIKRLEYGLSCLRWVLSED